MKVVVILAFICFKNSIRCEFVDSYVRSDPEPSPSYDTIIFRDMIDVINDLDNNLNSGLDFNFHNDSDEEDNIEDLLSEYQHFLDKARNQRIEVEKTKAHNQFPILNYDKYLNRNSDQYYNYNSNIFKKSPNSFLFSSDIYSQLKNKVLNNFMKKTLKITPPYDIPSSCYCQDKTFPCKCGCKQCIIPLNPVSEFQHPSTFSSPNAYNAVEEAMNALTKDKININMNVDIKLPKLFEALTNILYKTIQGDGRPDEFLKGDSLNAPFSYMSNAVPSILSLKPHIYKHVFEPTNTITLYKKMKNRSSKAGKRHRKKKIVTTIQHNNVSIDGISEKINTQKNYTKMDDRKSNNTINKFFTFPRENSSTDNLQNMKIYSSLQNSSMPPNTTLTNIDKLDNNTESIYLLFNISSTNDNITDDFQKIENSIEESDITKAEPSDIRHKRDLEQVENNAIKIKNSNKYSNIDDELLYWPSNIFKNSVEISKNITSLILERERKKAKLNITSDIMRNNHTIALERAIFGEIDWDDMDTVVPVFISFVGKYLRGILTFCSDSMCHSMKCVEKLCLHRVCKPRERFNVKGHCTGTNKNDSVAALESIMDLPSNIALETVDILENKLRGKMFGKATLCITPKCITFVASKKSFIKSKCTSKELTSTGHCPNIKIM